MKKRFLTAVILLLCCLLTGCAKGAANTQTTTSTNAQESVLGNIDKALDDVGQALSELDEVSESDVSIPSP